MIFAYFFFLFKGHSTIPVVVLEHRGCKSDESRYIRRHVSNRSTSRAPICGIQIRVWIVSLLNSRTSPLAIWKLLTRPTTMTPSFFDRSCTSASKWIVRKEFFFRRDVLCTRFYDKSRECLDSIGFDKFLIPNSATSTKSTIIIKQ